MSDKKKPDTAALLKSDVAVALRELGLDQDAITSLPKSLLTYLSELHQEFLKAEQMVENLEGEVGTAQEDLARLRRQRDMLRAALTKADGLADPNDSAEYSQPMLNTLPPNVKKKPKKGDI